MSNRAILALFLMGGASSLCAQQIPRLPDNRKIEIEQDNPQQVVAHLEGKPVTAAEFQNLLVAMDPKARDAARNTPEEILRYVGWLRRMGADAEKQGIGTKNPLKLQMEMNRLQLLSNAMIQQHELEEVVTPFEQRGYYQANQQNYSSIKVKLIYLPFTSQVEEQQAKRRAEDVYGKLKAGANFVALVKEFSKHEESKAKDGDYGEVRLTDAIPQAVKDSVFALKEKQFSTPVRLANGYYIFLHNGLNSEPYDKVKDQIFTEIKQKRNLEWTNKQRDAVKLEMKPAAPNSKDPNRVVAVLEGESVTAAKVDEYLAAMDEKLRGQLRNDPAELLRGLGFMRRVTEMAIQNKLHERSPYREALELARLQALTNAYIAEREAATPVSEDELKKAYEENLTFVSSAMVKIIFFPADPNDEAQDQQTKQLATEVAEKIQAGTDFVEMVKQYSKDPVSRDKNGDYGPLRITDDIPQPAKQAIWTLKPGQISRPIKLPNGYYLFKVISFDAPGLEKVRDELTKRMKTAKNRQWLIAQRSQVKVEVARKPEPAK